MMAIENGQVDLRWWLLKSLSPINELPTLFRMLVAASFLAFLFSTFAPTLIGRARKATDWLGSDWLYLPSFITFVLTSRWPGLLLPCLNPDEAQFNAAASKLLTDPVFWRSVDTGSSGPLNIYPLILAKLFGLRIEYASSRAIAILLTLAAITFLYFALKTLYEKQLARISLIPLVTSVALMTEDNYIHYAGEYVSIALLSAALLSICIYSRNRLTPRHDLIVFVGLILGACPYAKPQSVPIAVTLAAIFIHLLWKHKDGRFAARLLTIFLPAALLASVINLVLLARFSSFQAFWNSYILQNLVIYSKTSIGVKDLDMSLAGKLGTFVKLIGKMVLYRDLQIFSIITFFITAASIWCIRKFRHKNRSDTFVFFYYAFFFLLASLYAIYKPGSGFQHYLLFLLIPCGFLTGISLGEMTKCFRGSEGSHTSFSGFPSTLFVLIIIITASAFIQVSLGVRSQETVLSRINQQLRAFNSPIQTAILKASTHDATMAVWGWEPTLYVETGLLQVPRDGVTAWQIRPGPLNKYFQDRFLADMEKTPPDIFVDAVGPGRFAFQDRQNMGHETFPQLARIIKSEYAFLEDVEGARIYKKSDVHSK